MYTTTNAMYAESIRLHNNAQCPQEILRTVPRNKKSKNGSLNNTCVLLTDA